jgi:hypothetical protein
MMESLFEKLAVGQQITSFSFKPEACRVFSKIWPLARTLSQLNSIRTPRIAFNNFINVFKYDQKDANLHNGIYYYTLYMFQAVPPPIIRSS